MPVNVRVVTAINELAAMRKDWEALLVRSGAISPTVTPTWMLRWWETFGPLGGRALRAVVVTEGSRLVGLAPLLSRPMPSPPGLLFRRVELLASGEEEEEEICSDYIGIIAERGAEWRVAESVARALAGGELGPWDEVSLTAMNGDSALPAALEAALLSCGVAASSETVGSSHYIRLPSTWDEYLAALPSGRRYFVNRTLRDFEAWAGSSTEVERATSEDLPRGLAILESLHQERWQETGHAGVFAAPRFRAFHDAVIPELFAERAVELVWLKAHGKPVAAAYYLLCGKALHFYQSGRAMDLPRGIRPGIVLHAHRIRAAIEAGQSEYDFCQGGARYKADMATHVRPLVRVRAAGSTFGVARKAAELAMSELRALRVRMSRRGGRVRAGKAAEPTEAPADVR